MTNISTNEAIRKFSVSRVQLYNWAKLGKIEKIKSGVYSEESIQKYISEHNVHTNNHKQKETTTNTPMDDLLNDLRKLNSSEVPEKWKLEIALKCADYYFAKPSETQPAIKAVEAVETNHIDTKELENTIKNLEQQLKEKPVEAEEKILDLQTLVKDQAEEIETLKKNLAKQVKPAEIEQLKANLTSKDNDIARLNEIIKNYQTEACNVASPKEKTVLENLMKDAATAIPTKK